MMMIVSDALDSREQMNEESNSSKDKNNTLVEAIKSKYECSKFFLMGHISILFKFIC